MLTSVCAKYVQMVNVQSKIYTGTLQTYIGRCAMTLAL